MSRDTQFTRSVPSGGQSAEVIQITRDFVEKGCGVQESLGRPDGVAEPHLPLRKVRGFRVRQLVRQPRSPMFRAPCGAENWLETGSEPETGQKGPGSPGEQRGRTGDEQKGEQSVCNTLLKVDFSCFSARGRVCNSSRS